MVARSIVTPQRSALLRAPPKVGLAILLVATATLIGCPGSGPGPESPKPGDERALRVRIAQAEARRGGGLAELAELANHGATAERVLALRGLGRIGGAQAIETVQRALADRDPSVVAAAAGALGVAASLDELDAATATAVTAALVEALPRAGDRGVPVIEAIGRAGDATALPALIAALGDPRLAAASATALGRFGRRKLALTDDARAALVGVLGHTDPMVRASATWALAREQLAEAAMTTRAELAVAQQLLTRIADPEPEVRAQMLVALSRRKLLTDRPQLELMKTLTDPDWRVAVEAMRALTGDAVNHASRVSAALALQVHFDRLGAGDPREAQVVIEGLRGFVASTAELLPDIKSNIAQVAARAAQSKLPPLTRGWIECLAEVVRVRAVAPPDGYAQVGQCGHGGLPDHLRLPLLVELVKAKYDALPARRAAVAKLLSHGDVRVRAAGMGALAALWPGGDDTDHRATIATLVAGISAADPILAGAAVEAAPAIYDAIGTGDRSALDAAIVARARSERDVELASSLLELIGKRAIAAGADACRDALAGHPVRAKAGAACLVALGVGAPADRTVPAATAPPVDVEAVIGRRVTWHLATSRGELAIELAPDSAPWAVATIVALTRKGFYDGLEFHRVVPDFVVQGGDPTQSGWGGPGFAIPAEPATGADGSGYVQGGVGIADAGRDSGGSQWFIMHSRAAHLDGRYTWIGALTQGQKSADGLLIGDRVTRATIELSQK